MLQAVVFNLHDVILLLIICQCLLFAFLALFLNKGQKSRNTLLALLILINAAITFDTLVFTNPALHSLFTNFSYNAVFLLSFAFFLQGPVLYWYTKSVIYHDFIYKRSDLWHLIPVLLCPIYLYYIYYSSPSTEQALLVKSFANTLNNNYFYLLVLAQKISALTYSLIAIRHTIHFTEHTKKSTSLKASEINWLRLLVIGFLSLWAWSFIEFLLYAPGIMKATYFSGTFENYLRFIFINSIVFYSLKYSEIFESNTIQFNDQNTIGKKGDLGAHFENLQKIISLEQPYLNPKINLESLAERLSISPRMLSAVIHKYYQKNFFEFINQFRVKEAQRLLLEDDMSVSDIMVKVGYQSKSTFNRFFKKVAGMTPSEYRSQQTKKVLPYSQQ